MPQPLALFARTIALVATALALPLIAGCGNPRVPSPCDGVDDPCTTSGCPEGQVCEASTCACVPAPVCETTDECTVDADCAEGMTCVECACRSPSVALTPVGLEGFIGVGLDLDCVFLEERDCPISSFDADLTVRLPGDGVVELVQAPASQTTTGAFAEGVTFSTRDSTPDYDEVYLGAFERPAGTPPEAPLSRDTVTIRALNASGAEGSLATVDAARVADALRDGAQEGVTAAIDAMLAGTTGVCVNTVTCTFVP